jgi:c-di-GMP-binding flagellar brake protein YcgR
MKGSAIPLYHPLSIGQPVAVVGKSKQAVTAILIAISPTEISLELKRPVSQPLFEAEEQIRIKYWENAVLYCWEADVVKVSGPGDRNLTISIAKTGVTVQQRRFLRVNLSIPIAFTVIDSSESSLLGMSEVNCTLDLSTGGLSFQTDHSLREGDKLALQLTLAPSQRVNASGWVTRSKQPEPNEPFLVVVEFLQLEEEDQGQLLKFVANSLAH